MVGGSGYLSFLFMGGNVMRYRVKHDEGEKAVQRYCEIREKINYAPDSTIRPPEGGAVVSFGLSAGGIAHVDTLSAISVWLQTDEDSARDRVSEATYKYETDRRVNQAVQAMASLPAMPEEGGMSS